MINNLVGEMWLYILFQAPMVSGYILHNHASFIQFFGFSIKQPTSTYKKFTLLHRSWAVWSYKEDVPIFQENHCFL